MAKKNHKKGILLLAVGDELLDGRTINSNGSWMGEQLRLHGIKVEEMRCVSDDLKDIRAALRAGKQFSFVIATGGLGPTSDDRTLAGAASAFGLQLGETPASLRHVRSRYEVRGMELTPHRRRLALVPRGSRILNNPTGTAPGVQLRWQGTDFVFLPGPPPECRPMFQALLPAIAKRTAHAKLLRREFWRTFGRGESDIFQRVAPVISSLEKNFSGLRFGVHISFPCIDLTLEDWRMPGAKHPSKAELEAAIEEITRALDSLCFTRKRETLAETVFQLLQERKIRVAAAESCTGGLFGKLLTDLPGSSSVFLGGAITYANEAKSAILGVREKTLREFGAVSEATAIEMCEGARRRFGADLAVSITGVAGPSGGSVEKPVGTTFVGISNEKESQAVRHQILGSKGSREQNRVIAAHLALDAVRMELLSLPVTKN